jgi:hypothetical protein
MCSDLKAYKLRLSANFWQAQQVNDLPISACLKCGLRITNKSQWRTRFSMTCDIFLSNAGFASAESWWISAVLELLGTDATQVRQSKPENHSN